jgi:hypothetical protein
VILIDATCCERVQPVNAMEFPQKNRVTPIEANQTAAGNHIRVSMFPISRRMALNLTDEPKKIIIILFIYFIDGMAANPSLYGCAALTPPGSPTSCGQALLGLRPCKLFYTI